MGYNIEISFNILKNSSEIQKNVKNYAEECGCNYYYDDLEFENKTQFQRRHCVMTTNFPQNNIPYLLEFLRSIRDIEGLYLESIYDEENNKMLYASQYYLTQQMDKKCAKEFVIEKRKRSYSEDENMILHTIKK